MRDEAVVQEIKSELITKLNARFGYCGVAESDSFIMLNSGKDLIIKITWKSAPKE
jgi:hypothetical protein